MAKTKIQIDLDFDELLYGKWLEFDGLSKEPNSVESRRFLVKLARYRHRYPRSDPRARAAFTAFYRKQREAVVALEHAHTETDRRLYELHLLKTLAIEGGVQ